MNPTADRQTVARRASILRRLVILLVVILVGVGFYRGWIALSKSSDDQGKITLSVDTEKAKADAEKAKDTTRELRDRAKEAAK